MHSIELPPKLHLPDSFVSVDSFRDFLNKEFSRETPQHWVLPAETFDNSHTYFENQKVARFMMNEANFACRGSFRAIEYMLAGAERIEKSTLAKTLRESRAPLDDYVEWLEHEPTSQRFLTFQEVTSDKRDTVQLVDVSKTLQSFGR
ncbi:MAG: hypothetical protein U5L95_00495 [Candidatus Saccharibacteria bacterium]|nr:hypothetical protein [Candidatus Saccharibacteria bacterium]